MPAATTPSRPRCRWWREGTGWPRRSSACPSASSTRARPPTWWSSTTGHRPSCTATTSRAISSSASTAAMSGRSWWRGAGCSGTGASPRSTKRRPLPPRGRRPATSGRAWPASAPLKIGPMSRIVRCGLIQASNVKSPAEASLPEVRQAMVDKHLKMIADAGARGVRILCLQELFYGPYFAAEQDPRWYAFTERVPEGPTVKLMQEQARRYELAMVVPVYEEEATGVYYNTAAVIDADGRYLGTYRKHHIPHCLPAFR